VPAPGGHRRWLAYGSQEFSDSPAKIPQNLLNRNWKSREGHGKAFSPQLVHVSLGFSREAGEAGVNLEGYEGFPQ
jgi:hypothetical protein